MTKQEARIFCHASWKHFFQTDKPKKLFAHLASFLDNIQPNGRLLISLPLANEFDYHKLLGKRKLELYAPRTMANGIMEFRYYDPKHKLFSKIEAGYKGVPGPGAHAPLLKLPLSQEDHIILPSLGLHTDGSRLGRGGGYYDRWKEVFSFSISLALIPKSLSQLQFKTETHDVQVLYGITEKGIQSYTP